MKPLGRKTSIALMLSSLACAGASPPSMTTVESQLDRAVREDVAKGFSGAVLVARGQKTLLDVAYGVEQGMPIRISSRFWIASAGKQFTSAAVLKCQERGLLALSDPLVKFFPAAPEGLKRVTVRELLSHQSGLDQSDVSEGLSDRAEAVKRLLAVRQVDTVGHTFHYSNANYQLAVAIVEIASGLGYRQFVARELFQPAAMRDSGFAGDSGSHGVVPARNPAPPRLTSRSWGGEGVYSTTHDLRAWYEALKSGRVLKPENVQQLFKPLVEIHEGQGGLGWFIGGTAGGVARVFTRGNEDFGPNSLVYAYPASDTLIIVLTHSGDANDDLSWSRFVHAKLERVLFQ